MSDVSVVGLGVMGSALAKTLLDNGYSVTVWNRSPEKAEPLVAAGATSADSVADAVAASPATITCITSHKQTIEQLDGDGVSLKGKTIIELSTGGSTEAEAFATLLSDAGADWLIGIINAYPGSVGKPDTVLTVVGNEQVWEKWKTVITALGGGSIHVGTQAGILSALFAALFTTRQGFMFGMIYGALVCKKADIPLDTFADLVPVSLGVMPSYHQYFTDTVTSGNFDNPPATMTTYAAALDDALSTFKTANAESALPQLFSDLAHQGVDAGLGDKALTALVELLDKQG